MKSKIDGKRYWNPLESAAEAVPNKLVVGDSMPGIMTTPHWHAQVEVNYVFAGYVEYQMQGYSVTLREGMLSLFWGGMPHRVTDTAPDTHYVAIHLPLLHFFRLRLVHDMQQKLMRGGTLFTDERDPGDHDAFTRWSAFLRSDDPDRMNHAIEEVLLRIERIRFAHYRLLEAGRADDCETEAPDQNSFHNIGRICEFVAENFRDDIDSHAIALHADIHPKYAMNVFKKSTGMTLNEYVSLLRLSYAQSLLMREDVNVLDVALDSGFGSLSAFNKSFRKLSGMSPSDFKRQMRMRPELPLN